MFLFYFRTIEERQTAYKPGSVRGPVKDHATTIHLGRPLPGASRDRPGRLARERALLTFRPTDRPYLVLLPEGFAVPLPLPEARCALTAPFHPCLRSRAETRDAGGLFSVALSLGLPPPGVTRLRVPVEPGLSSPTRE